MQHCECGQMQQTQPPGVVHYRAAREHGKGAWMLTGTAPTLWQTLLEATPVLPGSTGRACHATLGTEH
jgi:hypothetical protein